MAQYMQPQGPVRGLCEQAANTLPSDFETEEQFIKWFLTWRNALIEVLDEGVKQ